jgi:hypothetical protein
MEHIEREPVAERLMEYARELGVEADAEVHRSGHPAPAIA